MNVGGKFLLGLTIILAGADAYLVTVLYAHRTKWQQQIEQKRDAVESTEIAARDAEKRVITLKNDLSRITANWGQFRVENSVGAAHLDVDGQVLNAQDGSLAFGAGTSVGIPEPAADKAPPVMHIFAETQDGGSQYLGEFALTTVQANQSGGQLTQQPPMPTSIAALQQLQGEKLRIRETIPSSWRGIFDDFFARHAMLNQRLDFQQNQLRIQTEQLAKSQAILTQRLAELNGDPQPPEGASDQVVNGLVVTIRGEETARNADQQELDRLRHEYARKIDELNQLVSENRQAVSELPEYQESLAKPEPRTASVQ